PTSLLLPSPTLFRSHGRLRRGPPVVGRLIVLVVVTPGPGEPVTDLGVLGPGGAELVHDHPPCLLEATHVRLGASTPMADTGELEIGRAHVWTPVTFR